MKNKSAILVLENISQQYNHPVDKRAFEKAIAAIEYCDEHGLSYYVEEKRYGEME